MTTPSAEPASTNHETRHDRPRTPHAGTAVLTTMHHHRSSCGDQYAIWTDKGRLHERVIIDTGEDHLQQPLPTAKVYARRTPKATYRWYIYFATTCGTLHTERLDITPEDRKKGYNRTEHLRQFTKTDEGSSLHDRCYG